MVLEKDSLSEHSYTMTEIYLSSFFVSHRISLSPNIGFWYTHSSLRVFMQTYRPSTNNKSLRLKTFLFLKYLNLTGWEISTHYREFGRLSRAESDAARLFGTRLERIEIERQVNLLPMMDVWEGGMSYRKDELLQWRDFFAIFVDQVVDVGDEILVEFGYLWKCGSLKTTPGYSMPLYNP